MRDILLDRLKQDLVGPYTEDEVLTARPSDVYLTGILWPREIRMGAEEDERLVEDHAGERPPAEVGRSAGDVPLVGEPDDGERALRLRHRIRLLPRSPRGRNRPAAT